MSLEVIVSGLGRTGTLSMKRALEQLGFGPCHHMIEVFGHPESLPLWIAAAEGRPDWEAIYKNYRSTTDFPGCAYWRELAAFYPKAKVLHTVRDAERWFESTQATILGPESFIDNPPTSETAAFLNSFTAPFRERMHDRDFMVDYFRRHTAEVERTIPKERLLIWEVGEGWDRLCAFLGVPVPDEPFPHANSREETLALMAAVKRQTQGARS